MKRTLIVLVLLSIINYNSVTGQDKYAFNAPYKYISLQNEEYTGLKKFSFSGITLIDARTDTSKVGFYVQSKNLLNIPDIRRLNYENGFTTDVKNFLSQYYRPAFTSEGDILLIVVKRLWISQYDTTMALGSNLIGSGRIFLTKLKLEFYLKNKEYFHPITRVDTSFITTRKRSVNDFGYEITDAIINCCDNLFTITHTSILQRKKYTLSQIHQFNSRIFDVPILQTKKYKKGIYTTFSEFLNNEPSLDYVGSNQNKYGDVLYLNDGSGKEYASNKFWGYSDGENLYIISGKNFFKLEKIQNTFEFYGIKNLRERFNYRGDFLHKRKPALDMFIYQVDMETGETY